MLSKILKIKQAKADIELAEEALREAEDAYLFNTDLNMSEILMQEYETARDNMICAYTILRRIQEEN